MLVEKKLEEMGIELSLGRTPRHNRVYALRTGNLVYLWGATGGADFRGKVGRDLTVEQGYEGAKRAAIGLLTSLKECVWDLARLSNG